MLEESVSFHCLCFRAHVRNSSLSAFFFLHLFESIEMTAYSEGAYILKEMSAQKYII